MAPQIEELEKMLNDGEGDDVLCDKCVEILEMMRKEVQEINDAQDLRRALMFEELRQDFIYVLDQITKRRYGGALDQFEQYCIKQGYLPRTVFCEAVLILIKYLINIIFKLL